MSDGVKRALAARPDGSFVSLENPAQPGEIVRVYVTGMGPVAPAIASNSMPLPGTESLVLGAVSAKINDAPVHVLQSRLAPNLIGVYEVAVQIDANSVRGNNVTLCITVNPPKGAPQSAAAQVSNVSSIAIQQPPPAL